MKRSWQKFRIPSKVNGSECGFLRDYNEILGTIYHICIYGNPSGNIACLQTAFCCSLPTIDRALEFLKQSEQHKLLSLTFRSWQLANSCS